MQERVRVGAAQRVPPCFDKKQKTLDKAVRTIEEAGQLGLDHAG